MRLDPASNPSIDVTRGKPVQKGAGPQTGGAAGSTGKETTFAATAELDQLLQAVRQLPEVREDAVVGSAAHVGPRAVIGRAAQLGPRVKVGADARVGAGVRLGPDAVVPERSRIPSHRNTRAAA